MWAQKPAYNGYKTYSSPFAPSVVYAEAKPGPQEAAVEVVCSPNNPDGKMQTKQLPGGIQHCDDS